MDYAALIAKAAKEQPSVPYEVKAGFVLHLDGDYCAYSCAGADGMPAALARRTFLERLKYANLHSGAAQTVVHLSHRATTKGHRSICSTIWPYQGNREGGKRPKNWAFLREYLEGLSEALISKHREADDSIAAAAYADPAHSVTHTRDKDMRMLPGWHLSWADHYMTYVEPMQYEVIGKDGLVYGQKWLWLQMLQGDGADNIPGVQWITSKASGKLVQCGDGRASDALAGTTCNNEAAEIVRNAYIMQYNDDWADAFVEMMSLLWLRETEAAPVYDFFIAKHSVINPQTPGYQEIFDATMRLKLRVQEKANEINRIESQASTPVPFEYTEW